MYKRNLKITTLFREQRLDVYLKNIEIALKTKLISIMIISY